jgi:isoleucyl-tRNA synthetase
MPQYNTSITERSVHEREEELVSQWKEKDIFNKGIRREGGEPFVTYDGPPFATGHPHYGHVLAMTIKDSICSHKAQEGMDVQTKFGWDCHGVPIEVLAQNKLQLQGVQDIRSIGLKTFNDTCRSLIFTCVDEWEKQTKRIGRFIQMGQGQDYKTMDPDYISSVWGIFGRLHDKKMIYKGYKVVPYSPALGTVLSDFEAGLNYQKAISPAITMSFPLKNNPVLRFLVWTTTPWSVPANVAIAVNPEHEYVKVIVSEQEHYVVLKNLYKKFFKNEPTIEAINIKEYIGQDYEPMFDCLPTSIDQEERARSYKIVSSDHVTDQDGTGCVHICPAYGVDDFKVGQKYGLPTVDFIDEQGFFTDLNLAHVSLKGLYFKKLAGNGASDTPTADATLIQCMKARARLFKNDTILHDYPFCWRTNTPLMYRAVNSYFLNVTKIKSQLIENNAKVHWHPQSIGSNRFGNWLTNANDWAISRTRFWGCPIPIWINIEDKDDTIIISSQKELEQLSGQKIEDLHRDFIDHLELNINGKIYQRTPEVFDCWFESGSMPYAQHALKYGDDANTLLAQKFPADFIAEGVDQTRGWFYALSVIGTALFGEIPFKNVVVNGILLGSDGKKMSKSVGNFPPIDTTLTTYGADALRLFLLGSPAVHADSLSVQDESIKIAYQQVILPILNSYKFFALAANRHEIYLESVLSEGEIQQALLTQQLNAFDSWLLYRTEAFKKSMKELFDAYDIAKATQQIKEYVSDLTHWYIRISRTRTTQNNPMVFKSLHYALDAFCRYAAPVIPFVTESVFQGLYGSQRSLHLEIRDALKDFSSLKEGYDTIEKVRQIHKLSLALREKHHLRQRQPIQAIYLSLDLKDKLFAYEGMLKDLINCKEIHWTDQSETTLFKAGIKLAQGLAARWKKEFNAIKKGFELGHYHLEDHGSTLVLDSGQRLTKANNDFYLLIEPGQANLVCDSKDDLWLVIDSQLNEALIQEGIERDFLREISLIRKQSGCASSDRLALCINPDHQDFLTPILPLLQQKNCFIEFSDEVPAEYTHKSIVFGEKGSLKMTLAYMQQVGSVLNAQIDESCFEQEESELLDSSSPKMKLPFFKNPAAVVEKSKELAHAHYTSS